MADHQASQLSSNDGARFGFIVVSSNEALFGLLHGHFREVVAKFTADIPRKYGRGGASANRFARLRNEKRQNYIRKVSDMTKQCFLTDDQVNVMSIILAIEGTFTTAFQQSDVFDLRIQEKLLRRVVISYGGENGFKQAIGLAADTLGDIQLIHEKKVISRFFDEVSKVSSYYCFGIDKTLKALEAGTVETLIVWENFDVKHYFLSHDQKFNVTLEIVTNRSSEGSQFVHAFDGIGGILHRSTNFDESTTDQDTQLIDHNDVDYASFFN